MPAESTCFRRGERFCFSGTSLTSSSAYTYYPNGNVATDTESTGKVTTYLYDDLGRLTSEAITGTNNNSTLTYTYDERGNRLTQTRGNATVTYTYDLNNRLTSHTASGVVTIYNYDNNGNTISTYVGGNYGGGYTYDLFNRQKTYTPDGTVFTTTTYRPDGMRHSIGNTKHIWDNGNIVGDITGSTYKQYFRALNLIYSLINTTTQYYRYNGHGDVIALTNASGTVTKTYTYNAFGEEQNINATDANPFRYCGEYFDNVSGTLYLRARNYNASIGRFTQEDPIRHGGNWYSYCSSNPINHFDPLGLFDWGKFASIAAFVAGTLLVVAATVATGGAAAAIIGPAVAGAAINVATSYVAAKATGQEFTTADALIAAGTGALCTLGPAGVVAGGVISGIHSGYKAYKNGLSVEKSLICGVATSVCTICCMGNIPSGLGIGGTAFVTTVYSLPSNVISSAVNVAITEVDKAEKQYEENKNNNEQTTENNEQITTTSEENSNDDNNTPETVIAKRKRGTLRPDRIKFAYLIEEIIYED